METRVGLRPIRLPEDEDFLRMLYFDRRDDLQQLPIDAKMKEDLILMQFRAQTMQYAADFPAAEHSVVTFDDDAVGRYIVESRRDEIYAVDLSILSNYRGRGIGAVVLGRTIREAAKSGRRYLLHVDLGNRAKRLYERLGFVTVEETQTNFRMEWARSNTEAI